MAYRYRCPPCGLTSPLLTYLQARRERARHRRTAHSYDGRLRPMGEEIRCVGGLPRSTRRKLLILTVLMAFYLLGRRVV